MAKITILIVISAVQSLMFVLVANNILEIKGMLFPYWFAFFTTAAFANLLGLNISSAFDSAILIYIIIPLVLIPMMVLSGAMFSFDKLNRHISRVDKVPFLAELMPTKWSYEALMVNQFKNNLFEVSFYDVEKRINNADFKQSYFIPELEDLLNDCIYEFRQQGAITSKSNELRVLRNEIIHEKKSFEGIIKITPEDFIPENFNIATSEKIKAYLGELNLHYLEIFTTANREKTNSIRYLMEHKKAQYYEYLRLYHNESVSDEVRKVFERKKIVEYNHRLIQKIDPVFLDPQPENLFDFRSHFFAPRKHFFGRFFDTYWFNICVIWVLSIILYVTLYYDLSRKIINISFRSFKNKPVNEPVTRVHG
jgi:hypothetical protein